MAEIPPGVAYAGAMRTQPAAPTEPPSIIYRLSSILEQLDLNQLFPRQQPLEIDLGSGDGTFLVDYAEKNPDRNFIGVERLLGRIRKMEKKARRKNLVNLRGVRIESSYFLRFLLPHHAAAAIHLYFPDPWPKRKHQRRRLVKEGFPALARAALEPGGTVYLRTDDKDYAAQITTVLGASPLFKTVETPPTLAEVLTDFERDFLARGMPIFRWAFQRD